MNKNAIIDIIEKDLKDIQLLLEAIKYQDEVDITFIDLLKSKHEGIGKEIKLLKNCSTIISQPEPEPIPEPEPEPEILPEPQPEPHPAPTIEPQPEPKVEVAPKPEKRIRIAKKTQPEPAAQPEPAEKPKAPAPEKKAEIPTPPPAKPAPEPQKHASAPAEPTQHTVNPADIANYGTPVGSIKQAMGISDRFLYQRELFGNNAEAFNAALDNIDALGSYNEAAEYLASYSWDQNDPTVEAFMKSVHRRFI